VNVVLRRIGNWLDVPSDDPDDARRRKLLNIILAGFIVLCILLLLTLLIWLQFTKPSNEWSVDEKILFWSTAGLLLTSILLFVANRLVRGWSASGLFIVFMIIGISFADQPEQLVTGRSLFLFTIPIFLASMLLPSWTAFIAALLDMAILAILARQLQNFPLSSLFPTYIGLAFISLLAWLSARGVEISLRDLRRLNIELDQRVADRTRELSASLARERIEAGRSIAILESITDGVIVFDIHGKAIVANPATTQLLNLPRDQVINSSISDLTRTKALDANNRRILGDLLTNPGQQPASYRLHWGKKTFSVSSAQVFDTEETPIGTVAIFRDYTHEAEIEKMKDTILATVSHELRTPLNAILGHVEMLKEAVYGPLNERQARASERVISNTHRLLDIVSDLLDQAQIQAGKMSLKIHPFKPSDLLDNVRGLMFKTAADKHLALTGEIEPELPEILIGDLRRLQQILVNLVNNALKFTEKGSVHIRLFCPDRKHWAMEVQDTGMGIPEDEQEHIFDPFRQVDNSMTRKYAGFGLGLSIVNQLVALMGGDVAVKSTVGVGSVFTVILPIAQAGGIQHE
jgi:PAS domain S-box-containing protein